MSSSDTVSLFCSQIKNKRFDDETLRVLESLLVAEDSKSSPDVRPRLRDSMRKESLRVIHEVEAKSVEHKLLVLDFFVRAFALAGDIESCLALRYEALIMRELKSINDQRLQVSYREWLLFAEDSFENRFYAVARTACEKALSCLQIDDGINRESSEHMKVIQKIKKLQDAAVVTAASQSVQAQATEYLRRKADVHSKNSTYVTKENKKPASILFRNGIQTRNKRKLQESQRLQQISITTRSHTA